MYGKNIFTACQNIRTAEKHGFGSDIEFYRRISRGCEVCEIAV